MYEGLIKVRLFLVDISGEPIGIFSNDDTSAGSDDLPGANPFAFNISATKAEYDSSSRDFGFDFGIVLFVTVNNAARD